MKNILLCSTFIAFSACASSPSYDYFTRPELQQTLSKLKAEDERMVEPLRGKFKEVAAFKSSSIGSHGFTCSGTDTIKYVRYMNIHTDDTGAVTAKSIANDCGRTGEPITLEGFQTKNNLYLYSNLYKISSYEIDGSSGKLTHKGSYQSKKGSVVFNESRQNNETWSQGLGNNYSYKTTGFAPENLWSQVDKFERNIVVKKGGSAAGEFQWGKALALGVGAAAGGGLSLDSATQASVISGIVLDSQANTSGTSNLNTAVQTSLENNAQRAAASTSLPENSKSEATANQSGSSYSNAPNSAPTSDAKATAKNSQVCLKEAFDLRTRYSILTVYCEGKIEGTTESRGYRHRLVATPVIMTEWPTAKNLSIRREANDNAFQKLRQSLGNIHNGAMAERSVSCSASESFSYQNNTATYEQALNSCLLYTSPSPRDATLSRMPSSA